MSLKETQNIEGTVERIVFHSQQTGWTVARVQTKDRPFPVTVVGNLAGLSPGQEGIFYGEWAVHPKFGEQFKIESFSEKKPANIDGIQRYLGSGLIPGIGPGFARRLVEAFGLETLDVIENHPDRLEGVPGLGSRRIKTLLETWESQKQARDVMIFLAGYGISPKRAMKIYKEYGAETRRILEENPYRLAMDVWGIGFMTADAIARKMGFDMASPFRISSGIHHVLHSASDDGHCFLPEMELMEKARKILELPEDKIKAILEDLCGQNRIIREGGDYYLPFYHRMEKECAEMLADIMQTPGDDDGLDPEWYIELEKDEGDLNLSPEQESALMKALKSKVSIITGGPGVGKTTILQILCRCLYKMQYRVEYAAPTGRASKRMSQSIGREARTIHRLLRYNPKENCFEFDKDNPLPIDFLVVDEASMVDIVLFHHLLSALTPDTRLLMVGDVDQLPSVGAGNVLRDLIESGRIPVSRLTRIYRQKEESLIVVNAHKINRGEFPQIPRHNNREILRDFYFIDAEEPERVRDIILKTLQERIPLRFDMDPVWDVQVLSPMSKRTLGAVELNKDLKGLLNPPGKDRKTLRGFNIKDKVMQVKNNYQKEVFNGDIGKVVALDQEESSMMVDFGDKAVSYAEDETEELVLAYACTVHKSQGSEFPCVIIPLWTGHYVLLQRNLIYTALTRARRLAVLVGSRKALYIAIKNFHIEPRHTSLKKRLEELL